MAGSMVAILIPIYLVFYMNVVAGSNPCNSIYVRPPAGVSNVRKQILAAKKSATEPDQVLFVNLFSRTHSGMSRGRNLLKCDVCAD